MFQATQVRNVQAECQQLVGTWPIPPIPTKPNHTSESNSPCRPTNKPQISFLGKTKPIFSWTCACHIKTFVPHFDYSKPTPYYLGLTLPIGSMYGIYANIGDILMVIVTIYIYSIHGSYGLYNLSVTHLKTALHQVELVVNAGEDLCNGCWVRDHAAGTHDLGQISSRNHLGFASLGSNNRIWSVLCVCVLNYLQLNKKTIP